MGPQFTPLATIIAAMTTAASAPVAPSASDGMQACEISNLTTNGVYGVFGTSSVAVTLPTTVNSTLGFYIPPSAKNLRYVMRPNAFLSGITTGTGLTAALAITDGSYL